MFIHEKRLGPRWADQKREREMVLHNGSGDGWQPCMHVRAQTPHWRCGQKSREGRARAHCSIVKMILGREGMSSLAREFKLHWERAGEARRGLNSKKKLQIGPTLLHAAQESAEGKTRRNINTDTSQTLPQDGEAHKQQRNGEGERERRRKDGGRTIPYRFRGAVRVIFSLLSMAKLVKNSRTWASKYKTHPITWQPKSFSLCLRTWNKETIIE